MATKKKTSKREKWMGKGKTYPIIVHGPEANKSKLRKIAKARGVSMAEVVNGWIAGAKLSKPKKKAGKPKAARPNGATASGKALVSMANANII